MKIKIVNADPWSWYSNNVGKVYDVKCRNPNDLSVDIANQKDRLRRKIQYGHYIVVN